MGNEVEFKYYVFNTYTQTKDIRWLNPKFFAAKSQIKIPITKKYFGFGYKGLVFCRNYVRLMEIK